MAEGGVGWGLPTASQLDDSSEMAWAPDWEEQYEQNLQEQRDEVMALESIFGEDGLVRVISSPTEADNPQGLFSLELEVVVAVPDVGIMVELWVPYEQHRALPDGASMAHVPKQSRPNFMRSESGRQWHAAFPVHHLPPLSLHITLPQTYPSDTAPIFTLSSVWLDASQLSALCKQLDVRWDESPGMPVLYTWVDWLQNSVLSTLALEKSVVLTPYMESDDLTFGQRDPRALPECADATQDIIRIIEYDYDQQRTEFDRTVHECCVCFCEYAGNQFCVIEECQHWACRDCMTDLCVMHVTEGTLQQLKCPDVDCKVLVPPGLLRRLLGEESYVRWERLCLQKALETMEDITWCPRCNSAVIQDSDETQAFCTNCHYSFCPKCMEPFHAKSACLTVEQQMQKIEQETKRLARNMNIPEDELDTLESDEDDAVRATREKLARLKQEFLSKSYIKKEAAQCPKCKIPIQKNGGCNKVTCPCGAAICWVCRKAITGYDHFNKEGARCVLFAGQIENVPQFRPVQQPRPEGWDAVDRAIMAGQAVAVGSCPKCRQRNLRNGNNNHIRCWSCKCNFCYQCKQVIKGVISTHYTMSMPCRQHGDT